MLWDNPDEAKRWMWAVMPYANIVKIADEEWEFIMETPSLQDGSARLLEIGIDLVVVTRGEHGCYYNNGLNQGYVDGFGVDVIDPLGAGDGFVAAMLSRLLPLSELVLDDNQLQAIMRYANAAGALTTQKVGVIPALPTGSEIEDFMSGRH